MKLMSNQLPHWLELFLEFKQVMLCHFRKKEERKIYSHGKLYISGSNMKHKIAREIICVGRKRKKLKFHLRLCSARVGDSIIFVLIS